MREASSAFNLYLLPRLLGSGTVLAGVGLETPEVTQQVMAKGTRGHDLFELLQEKQELSRAKCENGKQPPKIKKKGVVLVYRPFNKGHLQQQRAHPFGKEPPLLPAGFSPRNSLLGCFVPFIVLRARDTPREHPWTTFP